MAINVDIKQVNGSKAICLTGWDGPSTPQRCKAIQGVRAKYANGEFVCWYFPLDLGTCRDLRKQFPNLSIGKELERWASAKVKERKQITRLHLKRDAKPVGLSRVPVEAPTIYHAMLNRGYQTVVPAFAAKIGSHFNGDQPGVGKTIEELAALVEVGIRGFVLVIAPRKALKVWRREIDRWLAPDFSVDILIADSEEGTGEDRNLAIKNFLADKSTARFKFVLINPEAARWEFICPANKCRNGNSRSCPARKKHVKIPMYPSLFSKRWDAILADETHKYLMNGNARSGSVSRQGYGLQKLPSAGYKVGMSGTPFRGKPRKFWSVLHWLDSRRYSSQGKWNERYFVMDSTYNPFAPEAKAKPTDVIREDMRPALDEDLGLIMVRRTKRELHAMNPAWAPPEKQYVDIYLDMDAKQRKAYRSMSEDAIVRLDDGTLMANGVLAEFTRLKQLAGAYGTMLGGFRPALPSCKWDWIKEALDERGILDGDGRSKIVIASQFVKMLDMLSAELKRLKVPHHEIYGRTRNTEQIEHDWQNNPNGPRVMLLSIQAGGISLTLDAADDLILVDNTGIPDDQEQTEDRVHRTSRTDHQVTIYRLITTGTIEEQIAIREETNDQIQKQLLDGRRGVDYAKNYIGGGHLGRQR